MDSWFKKLLDKYYNSSQTKLLDAASVLEKAEALYNSYFLIIIAIILAEILIPSSLTNAEGISRSQEEVVPEKIVRVIKH